MPRFSLLYAVALGSLVVACGRTHTDNTATQVNTSTTTSADTTVAAPNECTKIKTSDWKAWVNAMPGPGAVPKLHVIGKAQVPTTGWKLELTEGPLNKMMPPTQSFNFVATAPTGQAGQVVQTQEVRGEIAKALPQYQAVEILCGRTTIATVPVTIAS